MPGINGWRCPVEKGGLAALFRMNKILRLWWLLEKTSRNPKQLEGEGSLSESPPKNLDLASASPGLLKLLLLSLLLLQPAPLPLSRAPVVGLLGKTQTEGRGCIGERIHSVE